MADGFSMGADMEEENREGMINEEMSFGGERLGDDANDDLNRRLRQYFDGKIVRKDLTKHIKEGANVPVYVLEYLLGQEYNQQR